QLTSAGIDHVPFSILPAGVPVACSRGASARTMAEHILAMTLACSRRLLIEHHKMIEGEFNQMKSGNRILEGGTAAIIGLGGVGRAVVPLFRAFGMKVMGINRIGTSEPGVDFMGTSKDLKKVLGETDVIAVCLALTQHTEGMIGARELAWCKPDAILINVSRGEVLDETALYEHLLAHPNFYAGLDAWWVEPVRHGEFRMKHDFLKLPNLVSSPHNSSQGDDEDPGFHTTLQNVLRVLGGHAPRNLVHEDKKLY
ncbi:MAG: NAD(P)-dependent oxidoreductase, partial [Rhodospirillales bacterium]|nr:NAD(P)-dependent oxidoreductase [Rhodospirillales bacterium]